MNMLMSWIALQYFLAPKKIREQTNLPKQWDNEVDPEDIDEIEDVLALLDKEEEDSREL